MTEKNLETSVIPRAKQWEDAILVLVPEETPVGNF